MVVPLGQHYSIGEKPTVILELLNTKQQHSQHKKTQHGTYKAGNDRREGDIPCAAVVSSFALVSSVPLPFPWHLRFLQILRHLLAGGAAVLKTDQLVVEVLAVNSSAVG